MEPAAVDALSAWATFGAAIATGVSAIFIAWQIALTRKSVASTEEALRIARKEFHHGQVLRSDAQRAAIDAEMPRLSVEVSRQSGDVRRTDKPRSSHGILGEEFETVPVGTRFDMPGDADVPLQVALWVHVANDGPRRALVRLGDQQKSWTATVMSGAHIRDMVRRTHPLSHWVAIEEARERGDAGEQYPIWRVNYQFPGDIGANEEHLVLQGGSVVERVPGTSDSWQIRAVEAKSQQIIGAMHAEPQPFTRTYWSSRIEGRPLESPSAHD